MMKFADPFYLAGGPSGGIVAHFSPDGKRFLVVVKRGNLEQNTNEYSLLLWRTSEIFRSVAPVALLTLSSSSNREAVKKVTWLDNDTITFLGERPGESQQLYGFNCSTKELTKLTNHPTSLTSYALSRNGQQWAFVAAGPVAPVFTDEARRNGIHVSTQRLSDLIAARSGGDASENEQIFLKVQKSDGIAQVKIPGDPAIRDYRLSFSPDGRYLVVPAQVLEVPDSWNQYEDQFLQMQLRRQPPSGARLPIFRYILINTKTTETQPLLDAPIGSTGSEIAWSPDGQSVVLSDVYLPLDVMDVTERKARQATTFSVEIKLPSREIVKISNEDLWLNEWDSKTNRVAFEVGRINVLNSKPVPRVFYRKSEDDRWVRVDTDATNGTSDGPQIMLEEDLNTPPRIVAVDQRTKQRAVLLDLNPQFMELNFGRVEAIKWKARDGREVRGGLYRPPDYVPGKRYPLVIQTHGFTEHQFWMDGVYPTAFAAQALASKGFVVLQAEERFDGIDTPKEPSGEVSSYEGAVDYLDSIRLIDPSRVGIIGFSRTCLSVKYALAHSQYQFAAAVVADGVDAGYVQYMAFSNWKPGLAAFFEGVNDGAPFGPGLSSWLKLSPGFHMGDVRTPLLIQALGPVSLLGEWEWFSGLSRLGKPVDLIYLPEGEHILVKPWEQMTSQEASVDWFCFWLKSEEDSAPAKVEQYRRWRELRKLHHQNEKKPAAPSPN